MVRMALGCAYVAVVVSGLIASFATRGTALRRKARIATLILAIPPAIIIVLLLLLRFTVFREPPTLGELQRAFPSREVALKQIVRMSDEDGDFWRIAPSFLSVGHVPNETEQTLPQARWDAYRAIFARSEIKLGIERDTAGDIFIIVDSVGILNRGHATGYLYCAPTTAKRPAYDPCALNQENGRREYDPKTRDAAYSFRKIADRWYAYDEGPS